MKTKKYKYFIIITIFLLTCSVNYLYGGTPPTANFNVDDASPVVGETITFTDLSSNNTTGWNWNFGAGATPATATAQNPSISYSTLGAKTVTLTASNYWGNDPETKNNYINVGSSPTAGVIGTTQTICYGATPSALTSITDGTGSGTLSYEWQTNASGSYVTIGGATSSGYQPPALTATTSYQRRTVTFYGIKTRYSAYTTPVTITVRPQFISGAIQTTGQTICYAGTPSLIGSATDASGGDNSITYQWRSSADGYTTPISGATSSSYTPPAGLTVTTSYQRYANDGTCNTSPTVSTGTWTVTVNPLPTVSVGGALSAICQGGTTVALGGSFGGGATGAIWSDGLAGGTFANNDGTTPSTTTYTASSTYSSPVTLTLTSSGGSCGTAFDSKQLTVNPTPVITSPLIETICSGESTNITPVVNVESTYSWTIGTITGIFEGTPPSDGSGSTIDQTLSIPNNATTGSVEYVVTPTSSTGSCVGAPFYITVTVEHPAIGSFE
jgi:PKD repeat protein